MDKAISYGKAALITTATVLAGIYLLNQFGITKPFVQASLTGNKQA